MNNVLFDNNLTLRQLLTDEVREYTGTALHSFLIHSQMKKFAIDTQVRASMRFLASGCFYQVDADVLGIDKSLVCRVLKGFCEALVSKSEVSIYGRREKRKQIEIL